MVIRKPKPATRTSRRQRATITTLTAEEMQALLDGHEFELVGRSPHFIEGRGWVAHVIGSRKDLEHVRRRLSTIAIRPETADSRRQVSQRNRFARALARIDDGPGLLARRDFPRGLGKKV